MQIQDKDAQSEPDQMRDVIPTSPEGDMKHHESFLQSISTTSMDDQAINSWIAQHTQGGSMEVLDPQLFQGALGQYGSHNTQSHNDLFTTMAPYHENDETRPVRMSPSSSKSLFPFSNAPLNCDNWMNLSPTTSKTLLSMNDRQQQPVGLDGQATMTDVTETATQSSNEIPLVNTPAERGKTVLTLENLDPETRSEVLDLLFRRKVTTTIEIV